jgi:hypothetical protein
VEEIMQRLLTEVEKTEIIEREWARAKNPKVVMRVDVQDETDENGEPRVSVVIALTCRRGDRNEPPRVHTAVSLVLGLPY